MSSESSELSPKMFMEDPESRAKPYQKGYFILKRELIGRQTLFNATFPSSLEFSDMASLKN